MKRFLLVLLSIVFGLGVLGAPTISYAYSTFFGEDLNSSNTVPLTSFPNASSAETDFLANLVGVGTEDFESFDPGTGEPLSLIFPGAGTATLSGGSGYVNVVTSGYTNGFGRYSIPPGEKYWEVGAGTSGDFVVDFDSDIAAFGFYGIDIGDVSGQLQLELSNGTTTTLTIPHTVASGASTSGSILYYGFIAENPAELVTSVAFLTSTGQGDYFAFDNFTIGSLEQVQPVPEPGTMLLLGSGLAGLAAFRRKFRKK